MLPAWQMMLPWRFSGHLREDWAWRSAEQLATSWLHLPVTVYLMLFSTRRPQDNWVGPWTLKEHSKCARCVRWFRFSVSLCASLFRNKADGWYWQQMAGHLLFGRGARVPGQWGGQRPTQWQDPVHLWQVHPGNDLRGCSQSLWDCPS